MYAQNLERFGDEAFAEAINALPYHARLMWLHAYQSYIWNHAASERVKRFGARVVVGDLVMVNASGVGIDAWDRITIKSATLLEQDEQDDSTANRPVKRRRLTEQEEREGARICVVTDDDIASQRFSFSHVVLPLPGNNVQYPNHGITDVFRAIMEGHGTVPSIGGSLPSVQENASAAQSSAGENSAVQRLNGAYRHICVVPKELSGAMHGEAKAEAKSEGEEPLANASAVLTFSLPPSAYATECVREIMKFAVDRPT